MKVKEHLVKMEVEVKENGSKELKNNKRDEKHVNINQFIKGKKLKKDKKLIKDRRWMHLMKWGESTGCHQLAERSLFFKGYQFPVCARCTGVILGYLLATLSYIGYGFHKKLSIFACLTMFLDWMIQRIGIKESTNLRRVITGIIGGFGLMSIHIKLITEVIRKLKA